jgi:hypothetical protein
MHKEIARRIWGGAVGGWCLVMSNSGVADRAQRSALRPRPSGCSRRSDEGDSCGVDAGTLRYRVGGQWAGVGRGRAVLGFAIVGVGLGREG